MKKQTFENPRPDGKVKGSRKRDGSGYQTNGVEDTVL